MTKEKLLLAIDKLIVDGEKFTFKTYSDRKDGYKFGGAPNAAWLSWTSRTTKIIRETVVANSAPLITLNEAKKIKLKGNYESNFVEAKNLFLEALKSLDSIIVNGDSFNELSISFEVKKDITTSKKKTSLSKKKVFIVHGHDHNLKVELEVFLTRLGLTPIILHKEADNGQTVIEKFENNSDVSFAFILLTPDEVSFTVDQIEIPEEERKLEYRARPNVIFEWGFFVGSLTRNKVCVLHKGEVVIPSDLNGLVYKKVTDDIESIGFHLIKELKSAGLEISL